MARASGISKSTVHRLFQACALCHCYDPNKTYVLNPNAWSQPAPGTFGTSAAYYGDYRKQRRPPENMSIGRTFRFKERASLNIRLELNNVFNRAFFNDPRNSDITDRRNCRAKRRSSRW